MDKLNFKSNDEFYTPIETVKEFLKLFNISKDKVIWCPFDKEQSNFVIELKNQGYNVIYSHIETGQDYYEFEPDKWDIIISNPPFTNKRLIIERALSFNKPFYLLLGSNVAFQNGMANILNKTKQYWIPKNITFLGLNETKKKFLGVWIYNDNNY